MIRIRESCWSVILVALVLLGCESDGVGPGTEGLDLVVVEPTQPPDTLSMVQPLGFTVQLTGRSGDPVRRFIEFSAVVGAARFTPGRSLTSESGSASTTFTPLSDGLVRVEARVANSELATTLDVHVAILNESVEFPVYIAPGAEPSVAPDGSKVATVSHVNRSTHIRVYTIDGALLHSLADGAISDGNPDWSPTGDMLVFETRRFSSADAIAVLRLGDEKEPHQLTFPKNQYNHFRAPAWSPDGRVIAFQEHNAEFRSRIGVMDADGSEPSYITEFGSCGQPAWSPGSDRLVCTCGGDLVVLDLGGNTMAILTESWDEWASEPSWSPDGRQVVFTTHLDGQRPVRLAIAEVATGRVRLILGFMEYTFRPDWSQTGGKILFEAETDDLPASTFSLATRWRE